MVNTSKIKKRMAELGITQKTVACALSIAVPTVSQKINNIRPMFLQEANLLAELLDIPHDNFSDFFLQ